MLVVVQSAQDNRRTAAGAVEEAKKAAGDLIDARTEFASAIQTLAESEAALDDRQRNVRASLLEPDRKEELGHFRESLRNEWATAKTAWEAAKAASGALDGPKARFDAAAREATLAKQRYDADRETARSIWGQHSKMHCINARFDEMPRIGRDIETSLAELETVRAQWDDAEKAFRDNRSEADRRWRDITGCPGKIAGTLHMEDGVSTFDDLIRRLDALKPPVHVSFFAGEADLFKEQDLKAGDTLGRPMPPPTPPRDGLVLLGWRDRDADVGDEPADALFSGWNQPVARDMDLIAVWGYRITVRGLEGGSRTYPVSDRGGPVDLGGVLSRPEVEALRDNPPAGQRFRVWQDADTGEVVSFRTPVTRSLVVEPVYGDIVWTVTWMDAGGKNVLGTTEFRPDAPVRPRSDLMPRNENGYRYLHWSSEDGGDPWSGFGKPISADITLYAVRQADHQVLFQYDDGESIPGPDGIPAMAGFQDGTPFDLRNAPVPAERRGFRFAGWTDRNGATWLGRPVTDDIVLVARYRRETTLEYLDRVFAPVEARLPIPVVAGADVILLVLLLLLLRAGGTNPPGESRSHQGLDPSASSGEANSPDEPSMPVSALFLSTPAAMLADEAGPLALVYPALLLVGVILAMVDVWLVLSRVVRVTGRGLSFLGRGVASLATRRPRTTSTTTSDAARVPPEKETCPTCGKDLVDGECPDGHTIVRCAKCSSIMKDGLCPHCGSGGEQEFCPTCNSELIDGECPRGHTIVRCPDCGSILQEGVCPRGCNADPLNLGWPGGAERKLGPFALRVISCAKAEDEGFILRVPDTFVVGRSSTDAKEPFVELLTITRKEKAQCSRQYVRLARDGNTSSFTVTLLNSSRNPAFVDGRKLVMQNETATIGIGGHLRLNPGYELELIEAPAEG